MLSVRDLLVAVLAAHAAHSDWVGVADVEFACIGPHCSNAEEANTLSLLQLRANSSSPKRRSAQDPIELQRSELGAMKGNYPYYHTSEELDKEVRELAQGCGGALSIQTLSDDGVDIDVLHIKAPQSSPVNRVFLLFGEHSRELIGPESGLHFLQMLCGKADPSSSSPDVQEVLRDSEFQVILNGNPRSRRKVENGDYCLRTNPNGVDLNRNWDEKFGLDHSSKGADEYSGDQPFSEPETRMIKKSVESFLPTTFLTVHSGTKGMYMPWAYDMQHTAHRNRPLMLSVLEDLDKTHCKCPFGAAGKEVGYPCPGTSLDWVYSKLRTPYVFAFEIYTSHDRDADLKRRWKEKIESGGSSLLQSGSHLGHDHFAEIFNNFSSDFVQRKVAEEEASHLVDDCFQLFNPDDEKEYNSVVQNWADAYLEMASKIARDLQKKDSGNGTSVASE